MTRSSLGGTRHLRRRPQPERQPSPSSKKGWKSSMSVKTLEELQAELADEQLKFERSNAALQGLGPDSDKQTREDLESEFSEKEAAVAKLASDIDRLERMTKAISDVPRGEIKVGNEPRTYEKG